MAALVRVGRALANLRARSQILSLSARTVSVEAGLFPKHLYMLDILRGIGSLSVVLWHYPAHPLSSVLWPFYEYGESAVQLFFVLSGFVFYFIYCDSIADRSVSIYNFIVLRFSRLYPLHFVTLLWVAVLQLVMRSSFGSFVGYSENDLRHFFLNLLFIQNWGFQYGQSFNGPSWSVSVEILLYAVFFVLISWAGRSALTAIIATLTGLIMAEGLQQGSGAEIGWGLFCFFAGGLTYLMWDRLRHWPGALPFLLTGIMLVLNVIALKALKYTPFGKSLWNILLFGGFFPSLVLSLAMLQTIFHHAGRVLKVIGDMTYATYLTHFPIALSIVFVSRYYGISVDYDRTLSLIMYVGAVIATSISIYHFFEHPTQLLLRNWFIRPISTAVRAQ